jgi:hypothetical protein
LKCKNCYKEHDGSYGSGKFCNKKCACSFATKNKRKEINKKISNSLNKYFNNKIIKCKFCGKILKTKSNNYICEYCGYHNFTQKIKIPIINYCIICGNETKKIEKHVQKNVIIIYFH